MKAVYDQYYAKLHGVVTEVSTMTELNKYLEGTLADEKGSVCVAGFDAHQQLLGWSPNSLLRKSTVKSRNNCMGRRWKLS